MTSKNIHCVTGAYGYSGRYIADKLLARGHKVITLTNSTNRKNPFEGKVEAYPFNFDRPDLLTESLKGVRVLYNTYWVRFNRRECSYADAVRNTKILFQAAKEAGLERMLTESQKIPGLILQPTHRCCEWIVLDQFSIELLIEFSLQATRRKNRTSFRYDKRTEIRRW